MSDLTDLELLGELGVELETEKPKTYSPLEARLIAGFEDILKFTDENGRLPKHGEERDIFERLYAVRLDQLRKNPQALSLLEEMDSQGLLKNETVSEIEAPDDEAILKELGMEGMAQDDSDITKIKHVAPIAHRQAAEEVASREVCRDFDAFEPLFQQIRQDLTTGIRTSIKKSVYGDIQKGHYYIIKGQLAYIAEKKDRRKATGHNGDDYRLRVIYDNGTESGLLMTSLQRSFYDPENEARVISSLNSGPLFGDEKATETGTIYVLRSKSELPEILPIRDAIVKIGVTGGSVKTRISNAKNEATYLLGDVEVVDEYTLYNISRQKLERLIHQIFSDAQLQLTIQDRFGRPFIPKEWFLVPPNVVAKAVELIKSGKITDYKYNRDTVSFMKA